MKTIITRLIAASLIGLQCMIAQAQLPDFSYHLTNSRVNTIVQDSQGYIWMGTAKGLNRYTGSYFLSWQASKEPGSLESDLIYDMCFDAEGTLWLATDNALSRYKNGEFLTPHQYIIDPVHRILCLHNGNILASGRDGLQMFNTDVDVIARYLSPGISWAKNIVNDADDNIWMAVTVDGDAYLYILDSGLRLLEEELLEKDSQVKAINVNPDGNIWISTDSDTYLFDRKFNRISTGNSSGKDKYKGQALFVANYDQDNVIVGIRNAGIYKYNIRTDELSLYIEDKSLSAGTYHCLVDRDKNIWITHPEQGYKIYPHETGYSNHSAFLSQTGSEVVRNMFSDSRGNLWMSLDNGYACYNPTQRRVLWKRISNKSFTHIFVDSQDRVWMVLGLSRLECGRLVGDRMTVLNVYDFDSNISTVCEDREGNIWVVNNYEFNRISPDGSIRKFPPIAGEDGEVLEHSVALTDPSTKRIFVNTQRNVIYEIIDKGYKQIPSVGSSSINSAACASDGSLWMGSIKDGLIHLSADGSRFLRYDEDNGLPSDAIYSLILGKDGRIWFNTPTRIVCMNPSSLELNSVYDTHFSEANFYSPRCVTKTPDGTLFFGGYGGLTEIPEDIAFEQKRDYVSLNIEYISVDGVRVEPGKKGAVELNHRQSTLSVMYSGLNLQTGRYVNYAYMMQGLDRQWNNTEEARVSFTKLPAGRYTLRIRSRIMNEEWNPDEISLPIIVRPSPWLSPVAKIIYLVLLAAAVLAVGRKYLQDRIRNRELALKQQHIDFVTNLAHEIRTPLTLITGPLKQLKESNELSDKSSELVDLMERNAERLKRIGEEFMDTPDKARRDEKLAVADCDISSLVHGICNNFRFAAMEQDQKITTRIPEGITACIDASKVEKILVNLLSNACKYSGHGSAIQVIASEKDGCLHIQVKDNGAGIPEDKQSHIFDRYDRLGKDESSQSGSGVGLHYSAELAKLHHGQMTYNAADGGGSVFTLSLPAGKDAYNAEEFSKEPYVMKYSQYSGESARSEFDPNKASLLVAEDNSDMRSYLYSLLSEEYNVLTVPDGLQAWETLTVAVPDLVISDVVMPGKDGISLCSDIKTHPDYAHIPVILLTAKVEREDTLKGLEGGADIYMPKPFDPDVLLYSVRNLIESRRKIQERMRSLTPDTVKEETASEDNGLNERDLEFINKIHSVFEENIDNEQFSVEMLAREMAVSYSKLYAKVKTITGQTPQAFLSTYKMNRAMEYLKSGKYTVSEVGDMVGASSPMNFSRDFKKHFGVTPSSVLKG